MFPSISRYSARRSCSPIHQHWVSYWFTFRVYFTVLVLGFSFRVLVLGFSVRVLVLGFRF